MKGVNRVFLLGVVGQDPEIRYFPDGTGVCNLSLATSESWKDKRTGEKQERTEWSRLVLKDRGNYKLAQVAADYVHKGSKIYIEGKLQTRKWQDKGGVDHYTTEIHVDQMQLLDSKQQAAPQQAQQEYAPAPRQPVAGQTAGQRRGPDPAQAPRPAPMPQEDFGGFEDMDIPFSNYELKEHWS